MDQQTKKPPAGSWWEERNRLRVIALDWLNEHKDYSIIEVQQTDANFHDVLFACLVRFNENTFKDYWIWVIDPVQIEHAKTRTDVQTDDILYQTQQYDSLKSATKSELYNKHFYL